MSRRLFWNNECQNPNVTNQLHVSCYWCTELRNPIKNLTSQYTGKLLKRHYPYAFNSLLLTEIPVTLQILEHITTFNRPESTKFHFTSTSYQREAISILARQINVRSKRSRQVHQNTHLYVFSYERNQVLEYQYTFRTFPLTKDVLCRCTVRWYVALVQYVTEPSYSINFWCRLSLEI